MNAAVLGELLAREKRRGQPAVSMPAVGREMSYRDFITTAYKSGNVLRYLGLSREATLAVEPAFRPEPLLAFLGAAQLGARVTFDPEASARVRLVSVDNEAAFLDDEGRLAVFGDSPGAPATTHWEKEVWSENPAFPPTEVDPDSTVLVDVDEQYSHRHLLEMAQQMIDELDLNQGSRLAIQPTVSRPEAISGLAAALAAGATAVFINDLDRAADADAALVDEHAPAFANPQVVVESLLKTE